MKILELLSDESKWTKNQAARDANGEWFPQEAGYAHADWRGALAARGSHGFSGSRGSDCVGGYQHHCLFGAR